jgi:hypothetical protein
LYHTVAEPDAPGLQAYDGRIRKSGMPLHQLVGQPLQGDGELMLIEQGLQAYGDLASKLIRPPYFTNNGRKNV